MRSPHDSVLRRWGMKRRPKELDDADRRSKVGEGFEVFEGKKLFADYFSKVARGEVKRPPVRQRVAFRVFWILLMAFVFIMTAGVVILLGLGLIVAIKALWGLAL